MKARMITRNVMIDGKRTTIRLESAVWAALDEICARERVTRHDFCTRIDARRRQINRAQAVRAAVVNYLRLALYAGSSGTDNIERALDEADGLAA